MEPNSPFDVTRRDTGSDNMSGTYDAEAPRGLCLAAHPTDANAFALADGTNFLGHLTRPVQSGGASQLEKFTGERYSETEAGQEFPFAQGGEVSLQKAREIEVEGDDLLVLSGTGAITSSIAIGEKIAPSAGKLRIAQTGDVFRYQVTAKNLTPFTEGALRIRLEAATGIK